MINCKKYSWVKNMQKWIEVSAKILQRWNNQEK